MRPFRVLHVPTDAGNHGPILAHTERSLGLDSHCIVFGTSHIGYKADESLGGRSIPALLKVELKRWWILVRALRYDCIHYNYGSSICPNPIFIGLGLHGGLKRRIYTLYAVIFQMWDVVLFKLLGKRIVVVFQGGDARQEYAALDAHEERPGYYVPMMDTLKRHRIRIWGRSAHAIYYLNPDLATFLPARARFLPYVCMKVEK